jgi:triacylglycerol lipase
MKFSQFVRDLNYQFQISTLFINEAYLEDSEFKTHEGSTDTQFVFKQCPVFPTDVYLAFRGTESFRDALTDIQCGSEIPAYGNEESSIRVHSGFYKAYCSVREKIKNLISETPNARIFISGHSLGGALALLCALDIQYHNPEATIFLLTIGQPKVGNQAFVDSTNRRLSDYYRVTNGDDGVPKFPITYRHAGELIEVGEKHWWKPISLEDHFRANYIRELLKIK